MTYTQLCETDFNQLPSFCIHFDSDEDTKR